MKKQFLLIFLLAFTTTIFSQQTTIPIPQVKTDYLKKSKHQKTAAWILAGSGTALRLIGIIIPKGEEVRWYFIGSPDHKNDKIKAAFGVSGFVAILGSIPLFIASAKNKKRGMVISSGIKMEKMRVLQQHSFVKRSYPALSVKISLR